ncbi:MAG: alcohol dehydrogenase, partial [Chloroflexi bacterium]|nr:alcohol dehydrogenase [Chloroflexota bacterium]
IGAAPLAEPAARLAGKLGEVILLGTPRASHVADMTPLLRHVHLWGEGCITFKGAHEWRYPVKRDPTGQVKHSIERNVDILLELIAAGKLRVEELITHVLSPEEAPTAYAGLRERKDEYLGVVFDWDKVR